MRSRVPQLLLAATTFASAQALFTGETGGKGTSSIFFAANASFVSEFTTPLNFWTAYTRGVHSRVDAFGLYGNITIFGQTQHYIGAGSNIGVLKRARHGVDVALLNFYTTPINQRDLSATVSGTFAPIASRPVRVLGTTLTIYGGYLRSEFLGARAGKLFTASKGTNNGMLGGVLPLNKSVSLIVEYDPGSAQQNIGAALLYVLPRK